MGMTAIADQVICIREEKEQTESGILIPDSAQKQSVAKVVSVGKECKYVKNDDTILLLRPGTKIVHDGKEYEIVRERADYFIII